MFIYVGCAGGMTSSMFCQRIVKAIEQVKSPLTAVFDDVGTVIKRKKEFEGYYDLVFAYGGINYVTPMNAYDFGTTFDVVFIAPQMRHLTNHKKEVLKDYPTIVKDIEVRTFGTMDGASAYDNLLEELTSLDLERSYTSEKHPETKNGDKNVELLILGGDKKDPFFQSFFDEWRKLGLRIYIESYSLEKLFDFHPKEAFDIRVLFGNSGSIAKEDFPKLSRRIDGVLVLPYSASSFTIKQQWFDSYQIPVYIFDAGNTAVKKGELEARSYKNILDTIVFHSEYTQEISPPDWETPPPKTIRKTTLFGLFSWE